jgi:ABC-type siderophore export system fused ATPase/permease subunit
MFALVLRSISLRSKLAVVDAIVFSIVLLGSYAYMSVVSIAMLAIVLVATLLSFRSQTSSARGCDGAIAHPARSGHAAFSKH